MIPSSSGSLPFRTSIAKVMGCGKSIFKHQQTCRSTMNEVVPFSSSLTHVPSRLSLPRVIPQAPLQFFWDGQFWTGRRPWHNDPTVQGIEVRLHYLEAMSKKGPPIYTRYIWLEIQKFRVKFRYQASSLFYFCPLSLLGGTSSKGLHKATPTTNAEKSSGPQWLPDYAV